MGLLSLLRLSEIIASEIRTGGVFEKLRPPLRTLEGLHFMHYRKQIDGIGPVYGLAVHKSAKTAQIVAFFESLDRRAFLANGRANGLISTNGVAAHAFRTLAVRAAINELHERDAFLAHWYTETPFEDLNVPDDIVPIQRELESKGLELRLLKSSLGFQPTYVCLLIDQNSGGFVTGTSSGKNRHSATTKAILEAIINRFFGNYRKTTELLLSELDTNGIKNIEAHRTLWLYKRSIPTWLSTKQNQKQLKTRDVQLTYKVIDLLKNPFPVVGVTSDAHLPLHLGHPTQLDYDCLTKRIGSNYEFPPGQPHPLF